MVDNECEVRCGGGVSKDCETIGETACLRYSSRSRSDETNRPGKERELQNASKGMRDLGLGRANAPLATVKREAEN